MAISPANSLCAHDGSIHSKTVDLNIKASRSSTQEDLSVTAKKISSNVRLSDCFRDLTLDEILDNYIEAGWKCVRDENGFLKAMRILSIAEPTTTENAQAGSSDVSVLDASDTLDLGTPPAMDIAKAKEKGMEILKSRDISGRDKLIFLGETMAALYEMVEYGNKKADHLQKKAKDLSGKQAVNTEKIEKLNEKDKTNSDEIKELANKITELETEIKSLKTDVETKTNEITNTQTKVTNLNTKCDKQISTINDKDKEITELKQKVKSQYKIIASLEQDNERLSKKAYKYDCLKQARKEYVDIDFPSVDWFSTL